MEKTTVYLEERQRAALRRISSETGLSVSELVRLAIDELDTSRVTAGRPRFGLFDSGGGTTAQRAEDVLASERFGD